MFSRSAHWFPSARHCLQATGAGSLAISLALAFQEKSLNNSNNNNFPVFRREEIAKHYDMNSGIWVTYKEGVFDITRFIENHPGGQEKILMAAGKAIDPFWRIYQQHLATDVPEKLLEEMRIGTLHPDDLKTESESRDTSDPYVADPSRHPALLMHNDKPCNAEVPPELMVDNWITPTEIWYIRHHHPVPDVSGSEYTLSLGGKGVKPILLDLYDLRHRFPARTVTATLQCGGNRRAEFNQVKKTSGIPWHFGAISTAEFKGVLLRDVLLYSGLLNPEVADSQGVKHIQFESVDGVSASIPIEKALSPYGDVLLAYEMNGKPLPREHGFPVRVVVPGHVGIRSIKWLKGVLASGEEAAGPWQRGIAYKGFGPSVTSFDGLDVEKVLSVQEQPVTSAIVSPQPMAKLTEGESVEVKGWAWSGGGRGIVRIDYSIDGGKSWKEANLAEGSHQHPLRAWAWTFWNAEFVAPQAGTELEICVKATDSSYNVQPERVEPIWNVRGLNNNAWHRVKLKVTQDED